MQHWRKYECLSPTKVCGPYVIGMWSPFLNIQTPIHIWVVYIYLVSLVVKRKHHKDKFQYGFELAHSLDIILGPSTWIMNQIQTTYDII